MKGKNGVLRPDRVHKEDGTEKRKELLHSASGKGEKERCNE